MNLDISEFIVIHDSKFALGFQGETGYNYLSTLSDRFDLEDNVDDENFESFFSIIDGDINA